MGIGQVLSELLSKKNTNAKALADEIGVTPSTIYSIIKRDNSKVDIDILIKICNALDVSVEYFYKLYEDEEAWNKEAQEFADGMYEREQLLLRYLSEYFDDAEEKGIASDIVRYLPAFNITGLKVAKERIEELTWIKKYINGPPGDDIKSV